jgi:hypothetical protein
VAAEPILLDTGPLAALCNRADADHARALRFFADCRRPLVSTEAVVTEVAYLFDASVRLQAIALEWVDLARANGRLELAPVIDHVEVARILSRYADLPCDYADATLLALARARGLRDVATLDVRDFSVYRLEGNRSLRLVFDE